MISKLKTYISCLMFDYFWNVVGFGVTTEAWHAGGLLARRAACGRIRLNADLPSGDRPRPTPASLNFLLVARPPAPRAQPASAWPAVHRDRLSPLTMCWSGGAGGTEWREEKKTSLQTRRRPPRRPLCRQDLATCLTTPSTF